MRLNRLMVAVIALGLTSALVGCKEEKKEEAAPATTEDAAAAEPTTPPATADAVDNAQAVSPTGAASPTAP